MEAQIALVTAELRRLQAAEGSVPPGRAASTENTSAGRAAHLEEQLNILIQQRLQHLETIQCQQIQLQVKTARSLSTSGDAESDIYFILFYLNSLLYCFVSSSFLCFMLVFFVLFFYFCLFHFCFVLFFIYIIYIILF